MILAYPFQIADSGLSVRSSDVRSQIMMLLNTIPGSRLHMPEYGFDVMELEQELLTDFSPERTLFTVRLQEQFARFIPDVVITDVTFEANESRGYLEVGIYYKKTTGEKDVFVWQLNSTLISQT
jgi:phage baseplate assembly protein W